MSCMIANTVIIIQGRECDLNKREQNRRRMCIGRLHSYIVTKRQKSILSFSLTARARNIIIIYVRIAMLTHIHTYSNLVDSK